MSKLTMQDRAAIAVSDFDPYGPDKEPFMEGYMVGATEQDKIARAEERERCATNILDRICHECKSRTICEYPITKCYIKKICVEEATEVQSNVND